VLPARQIAIVQQAANVRQIENSVRTVESLVDPLRKMSIHRFSRKSVLMNDNTSTRLMSMQASQRRISFAFTNNTSLKAADIGEKKDDAKKNGIQLQNTNVSTTKRLSQIKDQMPIRLLNSEQTNSSKSAMDEIEFPKNDGLLALATSIPLPPSPVEDNKKEQRIDITESSNSNNNFSSDIEKARLYEELEELEKQLEQEISEDMSEIL
jgi:hypothetical protein